MPRYRVTNRVTKETQEVEAPYAQVACERLGWMIGNCYVRCVREGPFSDIGQKGLKIHTGKVHKKVRRGRR